MKYCQLVIGPAGCGKSNYCKIQQENRNKRVFVINFDPACEEVIYDISADIRDLVTVSDVTELLNLGPNGALVFTFEYLLENLIWLDDIISGFCDDDLILFDCPGQIELYSHLNIFPQIIRHLYSLDCSIVGIYCLDITFIDDTCKFISGCLSSLSSMIMLNIPFVNLLTKGDLVNLENVEYLLTQSPIELINSLSLEMSSKYKKLNVTLIDLLEEYNLINFLLLNPEDPDNIFNVNHMIDRSIHYGEDLEPDCSYDLP